MAEPPAPVPVPLDQVPGLADFLTRLRLGALRPDAVSAFFGRNDTWAGVTDEGVPVFVKRVLGEAGQVRRRVARTRAMGTALDGHPVINTPRFLGADEESGLLAFTLVQDARSGADLAGDDAFTWDLAYSAGRQVGTLHTLAAPPPVAADDSEPPMPPRDRLVALSLEAHAAASGAELEAWALLHNDPVLVQAVEDLCDRERRGPHVLVHGDVRLDQFLCHDGVLHLTDWEEARLADAARDVGAFAGEWLYRGVLGMAGPDDGMSDREVIANGARRFEALRPHVEAFWTGYLEARPEARDDRGLAARAAAFAGWHLIDRIIVAGHQRGRLSAVERAVAGVGRTALLRPADLTTTLGLGERHEVHA
ncbi:class V lanthionine synthetase subunit LxmK [Actinomadura sp. ATCC 31491]|uniref:Class V lanthionine synthetase subunit LxmK n=1 Tax=Actinomadura luzonensis TaxID=2805427 RepID=A0ABT0FN46_9ACTN|nr:class V lanthionine synthetase subunit LxmK [Actinomadura luzonensis]MCK2213711.1 class V lanthionine synthetase subunit LxmK [Actinomadura luzonensis]